MSSIIKVIVGTVAGLTIWHYFGKNVTDTIDGVTKKKETNDTKKQGATPAAE